MQNIKNKLTLGLAGIAAFAFVAVATPVTTYAADVAVNCEDLSQAVVDASAGDTLKISGDCSLTENILINKSLTLDGEGGATISTNGTNQIFTITGDNVTIKDLEFIKTDKTGVQNIIGIQGANVTIAYNSFSGQYADGDGDVSRALEISTTTGVTINSNSFVNLRQPAYINDNATGTITNNYVDGTRGWVAVANTNFTFTDNSWGTNALDIAFIPGTPNNYNCEVIAQIVEDNNNANVQNQALTEPCPEPPAYPQNKDECKNDGWRNGLSDGTDFKNQGDCVSHFASKEKANGNPVMNFFRSLFR